MDPYSDPVSQELRGSDEEEGMPEVEAVCETYQLDDLIPLVNRLFYIRSAIKTFNGIPQFLAPLSDYECVGLMILEDEINRFEQKELKKVQNETKKMPSPMKSRARF